MKRKIFCLLASITVIFSVSGQTSADTLAIRQAVLDYIDGYYVASGVRMEKALHPKLAKRIVLEDKNNKKSILDEMGAEELVQYARGKLDESKENGPLKVNIEIYDIYEKVATVKASSDYFDFIDYCHLGKLNGEWKIINVLWELKPRE